MTEQLEQAVADVRRLAAAGDFTGARKRLTQYVTADPQVPGANVTALDEQRRTLEVLESLEVIRQLLRDGKTDSVAQAARGIREALTEPEYSRLGILGAALALLDRAADLSRRAVSGDQSRVLREETTAFVAHLGQELGALQVEQVEQRLPLLTQPGRVTSTLGDLLSRRSGRTTLLPTVEPRPTARQSPHAAEARVAGVNTQTWPVIGRILFAQEPQERVAPATQPQAAAGRADMFDLVGSAAIHYWHLVGAAALVLAAIGYVVTSTMPQKFDSRVQLERTAQSAVSAPSLGAPSDYLGQVPWQWVLAKASSDAFHQRVANRLDKEGWQHNGRVQQFTISSLEVGRTLSVTTENTNPSLGSYMVKFAAVTTDPKLSQALAGVAAEVLRDEYFEWRVRDIDPKIESLNRTQAETLKRLKEIDDQRLAEFEVKDSIGVGASIQERIDQLFANLRESRARLKNETHELAAAQQEEQALQSIAERIPPYEDVPPDARLEAMRTFRAELEREMLELARKRDDFGPEHPIQRRIKNMQEDLRLVEKEIEELERIKEADVDQRKVNPLRAQADSRLAEAKARTAVIELRIKALQTEIPEIEAELAPLRDPYQASLSRNREVLTLGEDRERQRKQLVDLMTVREAAGRELAIIDPPAEGKPVPRQELVGIAVGLIAGLLIGVGVAVALMRRRQLIGPEVAA